MNSPVNFNDPTGHMCSDPEDPTPSCDGSDGPSAPGNGNGSSNNPPTPIDKPDKDNDSNNGEYCEPGFGCWKDGVTNVSGTWQDPAVYISIGIPCFATGVCQSVAAATYFKSGVACLMNVLCRWITGMAGGVNVASQATYSQTSSKLYPNADNWINRILPKGSIVWGGEPGRSEFYTNSETIASSGNDATAIFKGLQASITEQHPLYRQGMTMYAVTEDINIAESIALANRNWGGGGFTQYYIPDYANSSLQPLFTLLLTNR